MIKQDHEYKVKNNTSKFMSNRIQCYIVLTCDATSQIAAAATIFYTNITNQVALYNVGFVPYNKLSSRSTEDYLIPSPEAQY